MALAQERQTPARRDAQRRQEGGDRMLSASQPAQQRNCKDCGASIHGRHFLAIRCFECATSHQRRPSFASAHAAVARAVRAGRLPRADSLACADCGKPAMDYDHRDYSQPLVVEAVCRPCNKLRGPGLNS